jgi:hypothetical protein
MYETIRRIVLAVGLAVTLCAAGSPSGRAATTLCVGGKPGCYATIQGAVDAAHDGDTIEIGVGTFRGGITILKDMTLVGAGAGATTIQGGGPVITIGEFKGPQPTVSISRVTITEGLVDSTGVAAGGGISIPFPGPGLPVATVSVADSVITGNRVTPSGHFPAGGFCGQTACAVAWGGGIDSSGNLTLTNTRVTDNVAGSTATQASATTLAQGGGIRSHVGSTLTLRHCVVSRNRAAVSPPNGVFSEGGGIVDAGTMDMEDSVIDDNASIVVSSVPSFFPFDVKQSADAGGVDVAEGATATISRSTISDNSVYDFDSAGDAQAINGGIDDDGSLVLTESSVDRNSVTAEVPPASGFLAGAANGGLHVGGVAMVRSSRIAGNTLSSASATGTANAAGAGIGNLSGRLTLEKTIVIANQGAATGVGGLVLGGGILNIGFFGPAPELTLIDSVVTANRLTATGPGFAPQGGGVFSADPFFGGTFLVTLRHTVIAGNKPDDCVGGC